MMAAPFEAIESDAAAMLTGRLRLVTFPPQHTIFVEGQPGDDFYIIQTGKVKIARKRTGGRAFMVAVLGPAEIVGELSCVDPQPRSSTAVTLTALRAITMDRDALRGFIAERPEIVDALLLVLARRIRHISNTMCDITCADVPTRVANLLCDLAMRFGTWHNDSLLVNHRLTQEEFAQLIGSSRETVNKVLSEFAQRGWIRQGRKRVFIDDIQVLAHRAGLYPLVDGRFRDAHAAGTDACREPPPGT